MKALKTPHSLKTVRFYGYERPERKFDSLEELKKRIGQDVEWGRTYFGEAEEG